MKYCILGFVAIISLIVMPQCAFAETVKLNAMNTVVFDDTIDFNSVHNIANAIAFTRIITTPQEPVYMLLASPGGNFSEYRRLKYIINKLPGLVLICRYCASTAGALFGTFPGPRYVTADSELLMHEMYVDHVTSASLTKTNLDSLKKASDEFNEEIYKQLGITKQQYQKKIENNEWILKGQGIVNHNMADKVVSIACDDFLQAAAPATCGISN